MRALPILLLIAGCPSGMTQLWYQENGSEAMVKLSPDEPRGPG